MQSLTRDPAIPTNLDSPLLNVRKLSAECLDNVGLNEIKVLVWLLRNCPALDTMDVVVEIEEAEMIKDERRSIQHIQRILDSANLNRSPAPATMRVTKVLLH